MIRMVTDLSVSTACENASANSGGFRNRHSLAAGRVNFNCALKQ